MENRLMGLNKTGRRYLYWQLTVRKTDYETSAAVIDLKPSFQLHITLISMKLSHCFTKQLVKPILWWWYMHSQRSAYFNYTFHIRGCVCSIEEHAYIFQVFLYEHFEKPCRNEIYLSHIKFKFQSWRVEKLFQCITKLKYSISFSEQNIFHRRI